jgi:hypothetical protein
MTKIYSRSVDQVEAPSLAPKDLAEILQDADEFLALIGNRPLPTVAEVAQSLTASAREAGANEIAEAASAVGRIASGHEAAVLAAAIRDLSAAIARARREYHLES